VRTGLFRVWVWVLATLLVQLLLLNCMPSFARTCDLLLLLVVALAVARDPAIALSAALAIGLIVDALSVHFFLLHTLVYGCTALTLSPRQPYAYMNNRSLLPVLVMIALAVKVLFSYLWATLLVTPLSPVYILRVSYTGILALLILSFFFGGGIVRRLKQSEVADFEVG